MSPKRLRVLQESRNQEHDGGSGPQVSQDAGLELDD